MTTKENNHYELVKLVLEASEQLPAERRVKVLAGLAEVCGDEQEREKLQKLVTHLGEAQRLFREFDFTFTHKTSQI